MVTLSHAQAVVSANGPTNRWVAGAFAVLILITLILNIRRLRDMNSRSRSGGDVAVDSPETGARSGAADVLEEPAPADGAQAAKAAESDVEAVTESRQPTSVLWPFSASALPDSEPVDIEPVESAAVTEEADDPVAHPQAYRYDFSKPAQGRKLRSDYVPQPTRPLPLDPFGAHMLARRPDRQAFKPVRICDADLADMVDAAEPEPSEKHFNDVQLRSRLIDRLASSDADPVPVPAEEFFTGNADPASLGLAKGSPTISEIGATTAKIGNLKGVYEVVVLVEPLYRQHLASKDQWPRATGIRLLTSLDIEDLLLLVGELDTIPWTDSATTYADGRPGPSGARGINFGWR